MYARPNKSFEDMRHMDMTIKGFRADKSVYSQSQMAGNNKMWTKINFPDTVIDTLVIPIGVDIDNIMIIYDSELVDDNGFDNEMNSMLKTVLHNMITENPEIKENDI
jgi:hypothetical protein